VKRRKDCCTYSRQFLPRLDSSAYDNTPWEAGYFSSVELTTQAGTKIHFHDDQTGVVRRNLVGQA
jgi:hypothetical protein